MADILICGAEQDRDVARDIANDLTNAGFDVVNIGGGPTPGPIPLLTGAALTKAVSDARAVLVIWSSAAIRSRQVLEVAELAAATGRLVATRAASLDPSLIPVDFRSFHAGPVDDLGRLATALAGMGIFPRGSSSADTHSAAMRPKLDEHVLDAQAWAYVNQKGSAQLIQQYLEAFPNGRYAIRAQARLAELEGTESPEENARRPWLMFAGIAVVAALAVLFGLSRLTARLPVEIRIATGDSDGTYQRFVDTYNEHLSQFGVKLVPQPEANGGFENVRLLAEGKVDAAFVKGGFAGALNDPEYLNPDRIASRGKAWEQDWEKKIKGFASLGRVMLEPLWVFTFGASESNRLNELDGEPINIGSMAGGTRTLSALLLESNKVRAKPSMWLDTPLPLPKDGEPKPLGVARALFLQRAAEAPRVQALLRNLATEKTFDKAREIRTASFGPKGHRLLLVLGDNTARIWSADDGREIAKLVGHTDQVNDAAFNADGTRVVTSSDDGSIRIWDATSGQELKSFKNASGEDINGVAFSPDGKRLVSASESDRATVRDIETGQVITRLVGHEDDLTSAVFSPDGTKVVTSSRDGTARIWDAQTGAELKILRGHQKTVASATFSPDGKFVATASWDNTARIWEVATGDLEIILAGHTDLVRGVEFSPDGKLAVTASWDDSAMVWDVATGTQIRRINGLRSNVNGAGFSPDGTMAMTASQDGVIRLWSTKTWEKISDFTTRDDKGAPGHGASRNLHLMNFEKEADAYISRFPFLSKVVLPRGAVSFEPHAPAEAVTLLATSVAIVVNKDWAEQNKSLVRALTEAIVHKPQTGLDETTRKPRLFFKSGQFPTISDPEYEASSLATPIYRSGDVPFLLGRTARMSRYVPFGLAAWIDEHAGTVVLSLIPLLGILIPLMRAIPAIYNWTVRRRILYWYRRLHVLESRLDREERERDGSVSTPEIDKIDVAVSRIRVPLNYSDQYYDLRQHIELVRQRLAARPTASRPANNVETRGAG